MRSQRLAILEYARKHDFRIDDFIEATASGQALEKRRWLDELMSVLQRGDRVVVSELSRLGQSLGQIVAILDTLAKAGVVFVALKENIHVEGKRDIQTNRFSARIRVNAGRGRRRAPADAPRIPCPRPGRPSGSPSGCIRPVRGCGRQPRGSRRLPPVSIAGTGASSRPRASARWRSGSPHVPTLNPPVVSACVQS